MIITNNCRKWILVGVLCAINLINYMDRFTVAGVLTDIATEWNLSDDEQGLIQTAFIVCFFASAPLFGFLGDRYSRKWLMAFGILAWGACTLASSFMKTFVGFLIFRSAIGFGEAGFTSIAPTVLSDLFQDTKRTLVLALFYFAVPVGSGLGYVVGSTVSEAAGDWRWGVRVTPFLISISLILLAIFMVDPPRGKVKNSQNQGDQLSSWSKDIQYLMRNKSYILSSIAFTFLTFCTAALSWFVPSVIEDALSVRQEYGLEGFNDDPDASFVGTLFGVVLGVAGLAGLIMGSLLSFWLRPKIPYVDPLICGAGLFISGPIILGALQILDQTVTGAFVLMFLGQIFINMNWAVVVDMSMYVVTPPRRASAQALRLMFSHAFGTAISPYLTGLISEDIFKADLINATSTYDSNFTMSQDEQDFLSLRNALHVSLALEIIAAVLFFITACFIVGDKKRADEESR